MKFLLKRTPSSTVMSHEYHSTSNHWHLDFFQQFIQANAKEDIKAPCYLPFVRRIHSPSSLSIDLSYIWPIMGKAFQSIIVIWGRQEVWQEFVLISLCGKNYVHRKCECFLIEIMYDSNGNKVISRCCSNFIGVVGRHGVWSNMKRFLSNQRYKFPSPSIHGLMTLFTPLGN